MKILLSAYACEPNRGSEPGVGWNTALEMAKLHQLWVFTSNTHRAAIEAELAINPNPNLQFVYFDPFGWVYDWSQEGKRSQWNVQLHYYLWQLQAYQQGRSLHRDLQFDLVHHITYVKYSSPSFLSLLPIPFIWGPIGGAEAAPKPFWADFSQKEKLYEFARATARQLGELDPFVRMTARRSAFAWTTTEESAERVRALGGRHVDVLIESGLRLEDVAQLAQHPMPEATPIRFISMGRLLHWKGFHLGIRAFAKAAIPQAEYWILGEGPQRDRLEALAQTLGVGDRVKFWGRLPRDKTLETLGQCHVLLHPSLHDSGGWVCLEAMAASRPIICLALGGPRVQVANEVGFVLPAHNPEQVIDDIAKAMTSLAENSDLRQQLGQAGHQHLLKNFTWESKRQTLTQLYQELGKQSKDLVSVS